MNNLTTFDFGGHDTTVAIRVVTLDGEPWFVAKDICDVLQIKNVSQALSYLDDDEKQLLPYETVMAITDAPDTTKLLAVSESGMYVLVLRSRKPEAKAFRKWIIDRLTEIRKSFDFVDFARKNPATANNAGFVYLVRAVTSTHYKIGKSRHPYKRLSSLQTGSPLELIIIERIFSMEYQKLELLLHEYYRDYWIRGEWFDFPDECVNQFAAVANQLDRRLESLSPGKPSNCR
jgi:prophage antirepressor-like protein